MQVILCRQVELRLSRHFYDLAALAPQDAEAYVRMREQAGVRSKTKRLGRCQFIVIL